MSESRTYPPRIYAGHLGGGRRTWKPELFDASEAAHSCEYVRKDAVSGYVDALEQIANGEGTYGAQAHEYKQIARKALGLKP
jgi:hypothetical protein